MELMEASKGGAGGGMAQVKQEPQCVADHVLVKEEAEFTEEECVKEECEDSRECGVSEAAMLAGLYDDHEVKDELVLGPERPHRPIVAMELRGRAVDAHGTRGTQLVRDCSVRLERLPTHAHRLGAHHPDTAHTVTESKYTPDLVSSALVSGRRRSCSVRLERLLVDAERRTCRVGRRTYKLHATEPAPTPHVTSTIYQCHQCSKRFRNKGLLKAYLQSHLKMHNDKKPFKCNYCDHRTRHIGSLRAHELIHTGE
ncbi:zinc finger protein 354C-like [Cydia splendana]|uniref:zinc finger protein 354C-like n=1 Tax=Cydia splendana TaxID=1100963 RepID=UPI00300C6140